MHDEIVPYVLDLVCGYTLVELNAQKVEVQQKTNKAMDGVFIKYARSSRSEGAVCYTSRFPISKDVIGMLDRSA